MHKEIIQEMNITFTPETTKQILIFLHGLGDSAFGWHQITKDHLLLSNLKIILLTAPQRKMPIEPAMPIHSWFQVNSMDFKALDFLTLESAAELIQDSLQKAINEVGEQNVFLGGFSQGGMMATYVGMKHNLKGIISLVAPFVGEYRSPQNFFVRIGLNDEIIPIDFARKTWSKIKDKNYGECDSGHEITMDILRDMQQFLKM